MLVRKALFAATILLSFHALHCMDSYDLYKEGIAFFDFIRALQQDSAVPVYQKPETPLAVLPQKSSAGISYKYADDDFWEPRPTTERRTFTEQQSKRRKVQYKVPCYFAECPKKFSDTSKSKLVRKILAHMYSQKHNKEIFDGVKEYIRNNHSVDKRVYSIPCMHEGCTHIVVQEDHLRGLTSPLMAHLYATSEHNNAGVTDVKKHVETYCS